ncbi:PQQ-binding-like beta-propeller repeat protein [Candidatus Bathyarchaeota archaeon]|nr:PQQ-binding-like beta-propeller repeat protein [Candidatus Bathyarchaeota archaeon]
MKRRKTLITGTVIAIMAGAGIIAAMACLLDFNDNKIIDHFYKAPGDQMFYISSPAIDGDGNIYIGTSHKGRWEIEGNTWSEHYYMLSFNPDLSPRWSFQTNNSELIKGGPAIHPSGLIIFVVESNGPSSSQSIPNATYNKVYALNMDGTLNWSSAHLNEDVFDSAWGSSPLHPAIDDNGNIHVQGQHVISCFHSNGTLYWENRTSILNYAGSPTVHGNTVYFPSGDTNNGYIYAFHLNGTFKWRFTAHEPACNNRFNMISIDGDGRLIAGMDNETVHAINSNGTLNWTFTIPTSNAKVRQNVAIDDTGTIYLGTKNDQHSEFYALHANGSLKWKYSNPLRDVYSSPTLTTDGSIWFGTEDMAIYRLDMETGDLLDTFQVERDITWCSPAFTASGTLLAGDMGGYLYAIDFQGIGLATGFAWPCLGFNFQRTRYVSG